METHSKRIQFPTDEELVMLGRVASGKIATNFMMARITDDDMQNIEERGYFRLKKEIIDNKDFIFYGRVNVENPNDVEEFKTYNFIWSDITPGSFIPHDFDYNTCTGSAIWVGSNKYLPRFVETFDPVKMYAYGFARLGKPKNVLVFKRRSLIRDNNI